MKVVKNKDFEKEFPKDVLRIIDDGGTTIMDYKVAIQFKQEEWEAAWSKLIELTGGGDQFARDDEGYIYIAGW